MKTKSRLAKNILLALMIALITSGTTVSIVAARPAKGGFSGVVDFKQLTTNPPTASKPRWIGSILQKSNSYYYEGMSVNQRIIFTDIASTPGDVHTLTFSHEATKGGIHAYDWLTAWDQGNNEIWPHDSWMNYEPCGESIGPPKTLGATCESLHTGPYCVDVEVPNDTFMSKDGPTLDRILAYEAEFGNREIRICGNAAITSASFTAIYHDVANYSDTGDSYVHYELTWESTSDQILIEMAGHLAVSGDPSLNAIAWGPGLGSSQIQGGPYHFKLYELDELSLGSQDNQIKGADILILPGRKGGYKWDDLNGDGIWQNATEPALDGWTIDLYKWDGATWVWQAAAVTGADDWPDGYYEFEGLDPADYKVAEDLQPGWTCTCPGPSAAYEFTVTSGFEELDNNFGNFKNVDIKVCKKEDVHGDGSVLTAIPGWTVMLYKDDVLFDTQTTGADGCYEWTNLGPGSYRVGEVVPAGWTNTSATSHDFGLVESGGSYSFTFTNFELGKKGGYKWDDLNGNGEWDDGEPGIEGWMIYLKDDTGTVIATTTTDSEGKYLFDGLEAGDYTVEEDRRAGWTCTCPGPSAKYDFTVTSGFADLDNNFGNYFPSWISDTTPCRYPYEYFDIVFTPSGEGLYKISSTNPGEFYFNILYHSWTSDPQTINYNLADGAFVTVGSMPIHAYQWNDLNGDGNMRTPAGCLNWTELTDITHKITTAQEPDLSSSTITISDVEPCTNILITIHINFDLKKTDAYSDPTAFEGTVYTFTANGRVATLTVENAKFPDE